MPSDIRSFFGGKPAGIPPPKPAPKETQKRGRPRKVISDDEDEYELVTKKSTPQQMKKEPSTEAVVEETTADDFFGKGTKPKRTEAAMRLRTTSSRMVTWI